MLNGILIVTTTLAIIAFFHWYKVERELLIIWSDIRRQVIENESKVELDVAATELERVERAVKKYRFMLIQMRAFLNSDFADRVEPTLLASYTDELELIEKYNILLVERFDTLKKG